MFSKLRLGPLVFVLAGLAAILVPFAGIDTYGIFSGQLNAPGTLNVLAIIFIFCTLALGYDLLLGHLGYLSFGFALWYGLGMYLTNWGMAWAAAPYFVALLGALLVSGIAAVIVGFVTFRVRGIYFSIVTLAFAQTFYLFVSLDPLRISGAEEGLPLNSDQVPDLFLGVINTRNAYWLALGLLAFVALLYYWITRSHIGHMWRAIRENEDRAELLGVNTEVLKLGAFVASSLIAVAAGGVAILLVGGVSPHEASAFFSLDILIMVILGGRGRLPGPLIGGAVYGYLSLRLPDFAGGELVAAMPGWLGNLFAEPAFVLGIIFVIVVLLLPNGIGSLAMKSRTAP